MKDSNPAASTASSPNSKNAPPPASDSSTVTQKPPPSSGLGHAKTELPHLPPSNYDIPKRSRDDPLVIGNKSYELSLRMEGKLGFAKARAQTLNPAVNVDLNVLAYSDGIHRVLRHVLTDLARLKKTLADDQINTRIGHITTTLANGILIMTYLKLRAVNLFRPDQQSKFYSKPKVSEPFEVPEPFGFAISQLGVVEVSSLPKRMTCYPTVTTAHAATYLLPRKRDWSQTAYAEAVRYAKDLGMTFSKVDLNIKVGSAWWLFKPVIAGEVFSLRCLLPEDNYTLAAAVINMLFHDDAAVEAAPELFNLANIPDEDYGSFIRGPREGFNLSAYYAISNEGSEDFWKSSS